NAAQVEEFARKARWQVHCDDMRAHRARCLDGRYKPGAGVIAMPGADIGVLACALIVAKWFAKRFDRTIAADDLREVVCGVVGGMPNFSYHTDRPSLTTGSDRYQ